MNTISLDQLRSQMPQAFVQAPSSRVSAKYSFIPTHQILGDLDKLGWKIREVQNPRYKSANKKQFGKHMVKLYNPNIHISSGQDVNYVEICLLNSSDGLSRFRMEVGVFRMACSNGLWIRSEDFGTINMRHSGYSFESLKQSIDEMIEKLPNVVTKLNKFKARELSRPEMLDLAQKAYEVRNSGRVATAEELEGMLAIRRDADNGSDLWTVLNRLQESVIRGGNLLVDKRGRMRTAKPLTNIDKNVKANLELWELAESYA